jgi:hypothetical protein
LGCKGHVQSEARIAAAPDDDRKWETPEPASSEGSPSATGAPLGSPAASVAPATLPAQAPEPSAFVGVMHDLSLAPGAPRDAVCRCLAVAYGMVDDPRFSWFERPHRAPGAMAVAIAAEGVTCDAAGADGLRASIAGVERRGADVVVTVENVGEGRPVMRGALVDPPGPGGFLLIQSRAGAPYGEPADGGRGACIVATR